MVDASISARAFFWFRDCDCFDVLFQFVDDSFDVVVDKGGLDALMEPELGPKLGDQYLYEVFWILILLTCTYFDPCVGLYVVIGISGCKMKM